MLSTGGARAFLSHLPPMADQDDILRQYYPPADARWLEPEDLKRGIVERYGVAPNMWALPPQQPRAELRNLPPRPGDALAPVAEALSPTMGAYGLGNALGETYTHGMAGDWKSAAPSLAEVLLAMAPLPGMKKGALPANRVENPIRAYHGSPHDFDRFDGAAWLSNDKGYAEGLAGRTRIPRNRTAGHVYEVDASVKSPYVVDVMDEAIKIAKSQNMTVPTTIVEAERMLIPKGYQKAVGDYMPDAIKGGHDSIHFRGTDDGFGRPTDQYFVFDANLIEILRKYGIAAPVGGGILANALSGPDTQ